MLLTALVILWLAGACAVLGLAAYRGLSQLRYACKRGPRWVIREPVWWWQAMGGIAYCLGRRQAIPWPQYQRWLKLK